MDTDEQDGLPGMLSDVSLSDPHPCSSVFICGQILGLAILAAFPYAL
jgi:hypothetical protein